MLKLQGLWKEYYSIKQDFIIVENNDVFRIEPANYKIDEWINVPERSWCSWKEYSYSFDMADLKKHLTFALLLVHQVRMHYVFMDVDFKAYYIFRGEFFGPIQVNQQITFFADRLLYSGWFFSSRNDSFLLGQFIEEGNQIQHFAYWTKFLFLNN